MVRAAFAIVLSVAIGAGALVHFITSARLHSVVSTVLGVAAFGYALRYLDGLFDGPLRRLLRILRLRWREGLLYAQIARDLAFRRGFLEDRYLRLPRGGVRA